MKASDRLSKARSEKLYRAVRDVLQEAIDAGSTLRIDLADRNGDYIGTSERFWRVYEREGEPCVRVGPGSNAWSKVGDQLTIARSVRRVKSLGRRFSQISTDQNNKVIEKFVSLFLLICVYL
jgi:hypothetical protein